MPHQWETLIKSALADIRRAVGSASANRITIDYVVVAEKSFGEASFSTSSAGENKIKIAFDINGEVRFGRGSGIYDDIVPEADIVIHSVSGRYDGTVTIYRAASGKWRSRVSGTPALAVTASRVSDVPAKIRAYTGPFVAKSRAIARTPKAAVDNAIRRAVNQALLGRD